MPILVSPCFWTPFAFWLRSGWRFPRLDEYLEMREEYKQELEEELREVSQEIERLKKGQAVERD